MTEVFRTEEFEAFPVCVHDDMLDAMARVFDAYPGALPFPSERSAKATYRPPERLSESWRPFA